jgi:hypothetical protein
MWASLHAPCPPPVTYPARRAPLQVRVHTSDIRGAGTDAGVYITLCGQQGSSAQLQLDTAGRDLFERGTVDEFVVDSPPVGAISSILVGHDNKWVAPQPCMRWPCSLA